MAKVLGLSFRLRIALHPTAKAVVQKGAIGIPIPRVIGIIEGRKTTQIIGHGVLQESLHELGERARVPTTRALCRGDFVNAASYLDNWVVGKFDAVGDSSRVMQHDGIADFLDGSRRTDR